MEKVKPSKAEKILVGITALFLCGLLALFLRGGTAGPGETYTVETERSAAVSELIPDMTPLDLNAATAGDLATLPGIGPKLAARIVDYRAENGDFASVDELTEVSGIGESKLEGLRDYVRVN